MLLRHFWNYLGIECKTIFHLIRKKEVLMDVVEKSVLRKLQSTSSNFEKLYYAIEKLYYTITLQLLVLI